MGLPLYVAPVKSDITAKPAAKNPADPAHGRSPIRRALRSAYHNSERRRQLNETREHRLRLLAALQDHGGSPPSLIPSTSSRSSGGVERPPPIPPDEDLEDIIQERRQLRQLERRDNAQVDRSQSLGNNENIRTDSRSRPSYIGWSADLFPSDSPPEGPPDDITGFGQYLGGSFMPPYITPRVDPAHVNVDRVRPPMGRDSADLIRALIPRRQTGISPELPSRHELPPRHSSRYIRQSHHVRYVDGLGDRDRSLSPEGDGVWDTLQSTLTPDPQPPSVGSSFASTTSVAASQTTSAHSSVNTSVTSPDAETEPPCDHELDESEDGDEAELRHTEPSRRLAPQGRRSYADVAAELLFDNPPRDETNDGPELHSDMRRIIRGLASRQDIPDEWWAEAGLSRSIRDEYSN